MSYCDDKKLALRISEEARQELEINLQRGIEGIIEAPYNNTKALKNKHKEATRIGEKKSLLEDIKIEQERFKAHDLLFKHLMDTSLEYLYETNAFIIPSDYVNNRIDWIQGVFQEAYAISSFANRDKGITKSGLNNPEQWDAGKIRWILRKIKGWEDKAKSNKELTPYENTMKMPWLVAASIDSTGQVSKLVKMTTGLLDSYLQIGYPWKVSIIDPITKQRNPISLESIDRKISGIGARGDVSGLTDYQKSIAASDLSEELAHSEVRSIVPRDIPTNPKNFVKWRNSWAGKQFFEMIKFESERHEIGDVDSRYVMIPLHSNEKGASLLGKHRKAQLKDNQIDTDPGENENAFLVYRIPNDISGFFSDIKSNKLITEESLQKHLQPTELEEGFFTGQEHRVYKHEKIPGTMNPKRKYANWSRGVQFQNNVYEPPDSWMPEMWEAVNMQREWNELFYEKILKKDHIEVMRELQSYINQVKPELLNMGWDINDIQEVINKISDIGGIDFNITTDKQGNFISSNSFVRKASKWSYGPVKFQRTVYLQMSEEALNVVQKSYLPEIEAQLATDYSILNSPESNLSERTESLERISEYEDRKKYYEEFVVNQEKRMYGDTDTDVDRRNMVMVNKILATKGRTLFTDHKRRRKDRNVYSEGVDQANRANELTRLKIQLFKTVLAFKKNPSLVNYLVDQVKAASGDADIEAGFMNLNYSDQNTAEMFGENATAETIRDRGIFWRSIKTAFNLGAGTSLTNNFQRKNGVINYGFKSVLESMRVMNPIAGQGGTREHTYEDLIQQVEETGVLHPGNAFIDMLTMSMDLGQGNSSDLKEALLPLVDLGRLMKATSLDKWLNQSKTWDKLILSAQSRGDVAGKIDIEELRRVKEELYDIVHGDYKNKDKKYLEKKLQDLKLDIKQSMINRIVKWKLEYFPSGIAKSVLTMAGSERQMRSEFAFIGFNISREQGRVVIPESGEWKYTDSKDAVDMARLSVYMNLFGLTKVMSAKMFRGAVGGMGLQFRQYDYHQTIVEMEWLRSAAMSPEWVSNRAAGYGTLPFRITLQIMKKAMRGGMHSARLAGVSKDQVRYWQKMIKLNPEHDDKNLERATNFFLISGVPTIMLKYLYFNFAPYHVLRNAQNFARRFLSDDINMRASRGLESMVVNKMITISMLLMYALGQLEPDDEEDSIEDALRELPFSMEIITLYLWIIDFSGNFLRGLRPYLPTPIKQISQDKSIREFSEDILD
tara:strand:+ start:1009 stop:4719 length:3711 start_codon:yes stop_codon:yes gene_type:complete